MRPHGSAMACCGTSPGARQHPRPDAGICGGEVSFEPPSRSSRIGTIERMVATRLSAGAARLRACRTENPRLRKHLIGVLPDHGVTFARNVLESRAVQDLDVAAPVPNEAGALQQT